MLIAKKWKLHPNNDLFDVMLKNSIFNSTSSKIEEMTKDFFIHFADNQLIEFKNDGTYLSIFKNTKPPVLKDGKLFFDTSEETTSNTAGTWEIDPNTQILTIQLENGIDIVQKIIELDEDKMVVEKSTKDIMGIHTYTMTYLPV